jgi:hypothetical protein
MNFFRNLADGLKKSIDGLFRYVWGRQPVRLCCVSPLRQNLRRISWKEFQGPGDGQREGQEDQGEVKELGGTPIPILRSPDPPGLPESGFKGKLMPTRPLRTSPPPARTPCLTPL